MGERVKKGVAANLLGTHVIEARLGVFYSERHHSVSNM